MSRDEASRLVIPPLLSQFALDHAVVGTTWLRPDGSPLYVNNALCRLLGYTCDELLTLTIRDYTPELAEAWASHWAELKRRTSLTFHTRMRRRLGEATYVEVTDHYVSFAGQEYGCVFVREAAEQGAGLGLALDVG